MKATVCELANDPEGLSAEWEDLARHVRRESSAIVLLPEMPFYPWPFAERKFDGNTWKRAVNEHGRWLQRLKELSPAMVLGSRPVTRGSKRLNQSFVWTAEGGIHDVHSKYYLPNEEGFWEASWYHQGDKEFKAFSSKAIKLGFLICSELWSMPRAMEYGKAGAHVIATPRATGKSTTEKWLVGGRACAVVSGCYSLSSNRISRGSDQADLGGLGWVVDPDGKVLGTTSKERPFVTADIKPEVAARAKKTYPRYSIFQ